MVRLLRKFRAENQGTPPNQGKRQLRVSRSKLIVYLFIVVFGSISYLALDRALLISDSQHTHAEIHGNSIKLRGGKPIGVESNMKPRKGIFENNSQRQRGEQAALTMSESIPTTDASMGNSVYHNGDHQKVRKNEHTLRDDIREMFTWKGEPRESVYVTETNKANFNSLLLDWHELVPKTETFEELVRAEREITAALIGIPKIHQWGTRFGPTEEFNRKYHECENHKTNEARFKMTFKPVDDEFENLIDQGLEVLTVRKQKVNDPKLECKYWVNKYPLQPSLNEDQKRMHYHFLHDFFSDFVISNSNYAAKYTVLILSSGLDYDFHLLGWIQSVMTDSCPIQLEAIQDVSSTCFVIPRESDSKSRVTSLPEAIRRRFELPTLPTPSKGSSLTVSIIHRVAKRFLVNAKEIANDIESKGHRALLLPLELMTPYEQVLAFTYTDVMVGIHGSGLTNVIFLRPNSALMQVLPFRTSGKGDSYFEPLALEHGVKYHSYEATRSEVFLHKEFLRADEAAGIEEKLKLEKLHLRDDAFFYSFLINQDVKLNLERWNREFELVQNLFY